MIVLIYVCSLYLHKTVGIKIILAIIILGIRIGISVGRSYIEELVDFLRLEDKQSFSILLRISTWQKYQVKVLL